MRVFVFACILLWPLGVTGVVKAQSLKELFAPSPPTGPTYPEDQEKAMLREMMKDGKKREAYIQSCMSMILGTIPAACERNLPVLDKSGCSDLIAKNKADARKKCEALARGETLDLNTR